MNRLALIGMGLLLSACASDGGDQLVRQVTMTKAMAVENIDDCPNGGQRLEHGVDANGNGQLDANEVNHVYVICHGRDADTTRLAALEDTVIGLKEMVQEQAAAVEGLQAGQVGDQILVAQSAGNNLHLAGGWGVLELHDC